MAKLDLSLTAPELESFLSGQRTIRLATATPTGQPHVVPLWFVTIQNLERNPAATGSVDDGEAYEELRGVLVQGRVEWAAGDPRLEAVKEAWSKKYMGGEPPPYDRWKNRVWFRLAPHRIASWDFRKIPAARAAAQGAESAGA